MMKSTLFGLALLLALGCSSGGEQPQPGAAAEHSEGPLATLYGQEVKLSPEIAALAIENAHQVSPALLTGGQLTREQMAQLQQLGYRTFINLRMADEEGTGWEEEYAKSAGIVFHRLPIPGAKGITRANAEQLAGLLEQAGDEPVAIYCASGNRVGALLAMKGHYIDDLNVEEAVAYGVKAGMTRLEPVVRSRLSLE
ncbi:MAG TPA: sulfur transferase domain-containing protein [Candidatus Polarisedimenticolia bacterium]|nr:sulfur transferase domain-containing protein [Candidatus Polarisedimenticolia bacterium]